MSNHGPGESHCLSDRCRLYHKARRILIRLAKRAGIELRQTYERLGKRAFIMQGRYSHARQTKRAKREPKKLRLYLGRVIRDIERKCPEPEGLWLPCLCGPSRSLARNDTTATSFTACRPPKLSASPRQGPFKHPCGCIDNIQRAGRIIVHNPSLFKVFFAQTEELSGERFEDPSRQWEVVFITIKSNLASPFRFNHRRCKYAPWDYAVSPRCRDAC
jgi:hypothetical protein